MQSNPRQPFRRFCSSFVLFRRTELLLLLLWLCCYFVISISRTNLTIVQSIDTSGYHYCDGTWIDTKDSPHEGDYKIHGSRAIFSKKNVTLSIETFLKEACPAQRAAFTCYFSTDNIQRAILLEKRYFIPMNNEQCKPFLPLTFLQLLRNRRVVLVGDSIMSQIWESLVCTLYKLDDGRMIDTHVYTKFSEFLRGKNNPRLIPVPSKYEYDNPLHGLIQEGYMVIRTYNTTLSYVSYKGSKTTFNDVITSHRLSNRDIIIFNIGLHYSTQEKYKSIMEEKRDEIEMMKKSHHVPLIFILQTTPQHFDGDNGYYRHPAQRHRYGCHPYKHSDNNSSLLVPGDWRNNVLQSTMTSLIDRNIVTIVPIAKGLRSQHDAHAELQDDCTHYCSPSGVFKYIHRVLFNSIRLRLQLESTDTPIGQYSISPRVIDNGDETWRLHPTLQNGQVVCLVKVLRHGIQVKPSRRRLVSAAGSGRSAVHARVNHRKYQKPMTKREQHQTQIQRHVPTVSTSSAPEQGLYEYQCYRIQNGKFYLYENLDLLYKLENIRLSNPSSMNEVEARKTYPGVAFIEDPLDIGPFIIGGSMPLHFNNSISL